MVKVKNRVSETGLNSRGFEMIIEEYNYANDITVKFTDSGNLLKTTYQNFKNGKVKNVYDRTIYGVGYFGEGDYKADLNGKRTKVYNTWVQMMNRCYNEKTHEKQPTYKGCTVSEKWHNFQVFAKWYDENFYEIEGERMELDKDILVKGNKVYSPENCIFVPKSINAMFGIRSVKRDSFPIGVYKHRNKYQASCYGVGHLGVFDNKEDAFDAYKTNKEKIIKKIAEDYKSRIPVTLYNALNNYVVEITD